MKAKLVAGALLSALALAAEATVLRYLNFDQLAEQAEAIVIGTVTLQQVAPVGRPHNLHTYVTLDHLEVLSGQVPEGRLTLRIRGGFDGRNGVHIAGTPEFRQGERVLLFVQGNGRDMVPFVGWGQGVFRLKNNATGRSEVHDADDNEVVGIQQGHVMRQQGKKLETAVVGMPAAARQHAAMPLVSGGHARDGTPAKEVRVQVLPQPAMGAEAFIGEVRKRARAGKTVPSVQPGDITAADAADPFEGHDGHPPKKLTPAGQH
jgi:hypothetical protein